MEYNRLSLVHQLGDEFILGMDIFDVDDIWDIIHNEKLEDLNKLADDVRAYIAENYKDGVTHTKEFIEKQIDLWILQYKWRYTENIKSEIPTIPVDLEKEIASFITQFGWGNTKHLAEKELINCTARHFYELGRNAK